MNPLEVSRGLKEGRIRLAGECNQCVYITEYDETGGRGETRVTRRWTAKTFSSQELALPMLKRKKAIHNRRT